MFFSLLFKQGTIMLQEKDMVGHEFASINQFISFAKKNPVQYFKKILQIRVKIQHVILRISGNITVKKKLKENANVYNSTTIKVFSFENCFAVLTCSCLLGLFR